MKSNKAMPLIAVMLFVITSVVGYFIYTGIGNASGSGLEEVIVKADNPNDPKYSPDPRLGLSGGGKH